MNPEAIRIGVADRSMIRALSEEARRRGCLPQQLGLALIRCALDMPDAVLDGADPAALFPHAAANAKTSGLTVKQRALLDLMASRAGPDGLVALSAVEARRALGGVDHGVYVARFRALARAGFITVVERGNQGMATRYRLTDAARAALGTTGGAA